MSSRNKKFWLFLFCVFMSSLLIDSCGDIMGEINNLFDPRSPDYLPPQTVIVAGPAEGITLDTADVTFIWRHANSAYWPDTTDTGNVYDYAGRIFYSYRVDNAWSDWISGEMVRGSDMPNHTYEENTGKHIIQLRGLEDGPHRFEVRSKYPSDMEESFWPIRNYSINAIDGTAMIVSPGYVYPDSGSTFVIEIKIIDVTDLLGAHLVLNYDAAILSVVGYNIKTEENDLLTLSNGDSLEFVENDAEAGRFDASVVIIGGTVTGISGSGILARIRFQHIGQTGLSDLEIAPESSLRNVYNEELLEIRRGGHVVVW